MRRPDRVAGPCCNMAECSGRVYRPPMPTANRFAGVAWHATSLDHAPGTPADLPAYLDHVLAHTRSEGGRFNPPGEFGAIYLALDPDTARREGDAAELCAGDHAPCQQAGRTIRDDGYEAIRYPSAAGDGINLAVFWDRRRPDSSLRLAGRSAAGG
jgi:hypothetical protein